MAGPDHTTRRELFDFLTEDAKYEMVRAYDRKTGEQLWEVSWEGSMRVPFFAASNGSWIRSTPAYDGHPHPDSLRRHGLHQRLRREIDPVENRTPGRRLRDQRSLGQQAAGLHVDAVCGNEVFIREIRAIAAYDWTTTGSASTAAPSALPLIEGTMPSARPTPEPVLGL